VPVASGIQLFHSQNPLSVQVKKAHLVKFVKVWTYPNSKKNHCSLDHGLVACFNMFQHVSNISGVFNHTWDGGDDNCSIL
jgi:hypothetical protein